jgi:flagellar biosynthesis protein FlhB
MTILEIAFEFCGVFLCYLLCHQQLIYRFVGPGDFVEKGLKQWVWKKSLKMKRMDYEEEFKTGEPKSS